jgi:hypothetical protein
MTGMPYSYSSQEWPLCLACKPYTRMELDGSNRSITVRYCSIIYRKGLQPELTIIKFESLTGLHSKHRLLALHTND